jgi:hypothetical protein
MIIQRLGEGFVLEDRGTESGVPQYAIFTADSILAKGQFVCSCERLPWAYEIIDALVTARHAEDYYE